MLIPALRNCTEPSRNKPWAPPSWKLYTSTALLQLIAHGPNEALPSQERPLIVNGPLLSADAPPTAYPPGTSVRPKYKFGRPASSATTIVAEVPSVTSAILVGVSLTMTPRRSPVGGISPSVIRPGSTPWVAL